MKFLTMPTIDIHLSLPIKSQKRLSIIRCYGSSSPRDARGRAMAEPTAAESRGLVAGSEARGKPFDFWVETGKIREFAWATGTKDPAYAEAQPVSPPTYLMTANLWQSAENAPWG